MNDFNYNRLQYDLEQARIKVADLEQTKTKILEDYRKERERYADHKSSYLVLQPESLYQDIFQNLHVF